MQEKKSRIGIFGGTFDPVHNGHIAAARKLIGIHELDSLIFIPAALPPHKRQPLASFAHRVTMLELSLSHEKKTDVSLLEGERTTPSYTIDTIIDLKKRLGEQQFFLIIGADAFLDLHLWYRYQNLLTETNFIIMARPGFSFSSIQDQFKLLPGSFLQEDSTNVWRHTSGRYFYYVSDLAEKVSSTEIRHNLQAGLDVQQYLPPDVLAYIKKHKLYQ